MSNPEYHSVQRIYDETSEDRPTRLSTGTTVWSLVEGLHGSGNLSCRNPSTRDNTQIVIPSDLIPESVGPITVFREDGFLNQKLKSHPVRVAIVDKTGRHMGSLLSIDLWPPSDGRIDWEKLSEEAERSGSMEWEGTDQSLDEERVGRRSTVFEDPTRGSKNDLL